MFAWFNQEPASDPRREEETVTVAFTCWLTIHKPFRIPYHVPHSKEHGYSTVKSRFAYALIAFFAAIASMSNAQARDGDEDVSPFFSVDSTFVWVPVLVTTKHGRTLSDADISDLRLLDNGQLQKVMEVNTNGLPVSLVVLMQTGGSANRFLPLYTDVPELIGHLVGASVHEITLVTFDSRVEQIWHFPVRTDGMNYALTHLHPGDKGPAIKDAVSFGVRQLQGEPGRFRRVVLLLSQGEDAGSSISSQSLLEQLGTSSTVVYSLTFPEETKHAAQVRDRIRTDALNEELKRTNRALDYQTAEEVASLTGGTDFQFDDQRGFNSAILETISGFHDGITLGFQPNGHEVGFHRIDLQVGSPKLRVTARQVYWWERSN